MSEKGPKARQGRKQADQFVDPEQRKRELLKILPELTLPEVSLFDQFEAQAYSCYSGICKPAPGEDAMARKTLRVIPPDQLWPEPDDQLIPPLGEAAHDQLRAYILGEYYPCAGARAAFTQGTYRIGWYKELAHLSSVAPMGRDLRRFTQEYREIGEFATFIAIFKHPQSLTEEEFEKRLWLHLQMLHEHDVDDWDPHYSPNPDDPTFGFSFNKEAFFVVGMNPSASRFARRFGFTALAFNPESQIRKLKEHGLLQKFTTAVRQRDILFQGSLNPSLPRAADTSGGEARVYSGMAHPVGDGWQCPFHPRPAVAQVHEQRRLTESVQQDADDNAANPQE